MGTEVSISAGRNTYEDMEIEREKREEGEAFMRDSVHS